MKFILFNFHSYKIREHVIDCNLIYRSWDIDCELLTPEQCKEKCPLINIDDIQGGLWIPGDGVGDPYEICQSIIMEAKRLGKIPF